MATVGASELESVNPVVADVQFIPGDANEKDAKVDINYGAPKPTFVGLGKDELEKYVNDPFWVRLRWILFIAFWILWVGLLAGAMLIIFLTDGCAEVKSNSTAIEDVYASIMTTLEPSSHHH